MTDQCFLCGGPHGFRECPMMSDTKTYLDAFAPKADQPPPEEAPASSLPQTLLEEMYGPDAISALMDIADSGPIVDPNNPDAPPIPSPWSDEQRELAWMLLSGQKDLRSLNRDEVDEVNEIARQISWAPKPGRPAQEIAPRKAQPFDIPEGGLRMPELDRPGVSPDTTAPIVDDEWPDLD